MDTQIRPRDSLPQSQRPFPLLNLPLELQLMIYEYATVSPEVLPLNAPCSRAFLHDIPTAKIWRRKYLEFKDERDLWSAGRKHAPVPPAITQTCRTIRSHALPLFYKKNIFRAGYCDECDVDAAVRWLERIGAENRRSLRNFYFHDRDPEQDAEHPADLAKLEKCKVFRGMGGVRFDVSTKNSCRHLVRFTEVRQ